jgi:hypothetical protein
MAYEEDKKINELDEAASVTDETKLVVANNGKAEYVERQSLGLASTAALSSHTEDTGNPHEVTLGQAREEGNVLGGDTVVGDDHGLFLDGAGSRGFRFNASDLDYGVEIIKSPTDGEAALVAREDLTIYSNADTEGNGNWEPFLHFDSDGAVMLANSGYPTGSPGINLDAKGDLLLSSLTGTVELWSVEGDIKLNADGDIDADNNPLVNVASLNTHTIPGGTDTLATLSDLAALDTDDIAEGDNLYHTAARAIAAVGGQVNDEGEGESDLWSAAKILAELDNKADEANAMGTVVHGATAGTARPSGYAVITWIGSVEPTNAENNDVWIDTSS